MTVVQWASHFATGFTEHHIMADSMYFNNQFLIAMPSLADPQFARTVTYVCSHDANGALGIVINRPSDLTLQDLLSHLHMPPLTSPALAQQPVFMGGPVQMQQGFVLHTPIGDWEATLPLTEELGLTTSSDILRHFGKVTQPSRVLVALGYAGWGAGQLEREMLDNAWLSGPADLGVLFNTPINERWSAAAGLLGIDPRLLSSEMGHA